MWLFQFRGPGDGALRRNHETCEDSHEDHGIVSGCAESSELRGEDVELCMLEHFQSKHNKCEGRIRSRGIFSERPYQWTDRQARPVQVLHPPTKSLDIASHLPNLCVDVPDPEPSQTLLLALWDTATAVSQSTACTI